MSTQASSSPSHDYRVSTSMLTTIMVTCDADTLVRTLAFPKRGELSEAEPLQTDGDFASIRLAP